MEKKTETTVACPFCGQVNVTTRNRNEKGVPEKYIGALYCNCADAKRYQAKNSSKDGLDKIIDGFAEYAEERGISITEADRNVLRTTSEAVIDERFDSISLKVDTLTVKLSLDKDGALKFGVVYKSGYSQLT